MRAFYRAAVGESARPAAARPYRVLTADKLLHELRENHEILEHVAVRSRRATSPAGDLGPAVAVTGEPRQANLVERALHRHQHLHHSQRDRPYQQIQLRFHRSSLLLDCGRYGTPVLAAPAGLTRADC